MLIRTRSSTARSSPQRSSPRSYRPGTPRGSSRRRARCSSSGPIACASKRGAGSPKKSPPSARRWPCTASSASPAPSAAPRCSASPTPTTRPTTARAARPAASCSPIAASPASCTTTGRRPSRSWKSGGSSRCTAVAPRSGATRCTRGKAPSFRESAAGTHRAFPPLGQGGNAHAPAPRMGIAAGGPDGLVVRSHLRAGELPLVLERVARRDVPRPAPHRLALSALRSAGEAPRLLRQLAIGRQVRLQQCAMHRLLVGAARHVYRLAGIGVVARVIHVRRQRHGRGREVLHLLRAPAVLGEVLGQLHHVLHLAAGMAGDEVGDEVLLLARLARGLLEQLLEAREHLLARLLHHLHYAGRDVL